jgi:hypothetical protein
MLVHAVHSARPFQTRRPCAPASSGLELSALPAVPAGWRARVLLWPEGDCKPLCVKMTGSGSSVENFGRTASC